MGDLRDAFDRSVDANRRLNQGVDDGLVATGRRVAEQIDYAVENLTGQDLTKALYLTPHLMNVLKEMLATPASRHAAGISDEEGGSGILGDLQAAQAKRKKRTA